MDSNQINPGQIHPDTKFANMTMAELMNRLQIGDKDALEYLRQYKIKLEEVEKTFELSKGQK